MAQQTKAEKEVWSAFMNSPGPLAVALYDQATKILTARNLIKPPRTRKPKAKPDA